MLSTSSLHSLVQDQNGLYEEALKQDRQNTNLSIEERMDTYAKLLEKLSIKHHKLQAEQNRLHSIEYMNSLTPQARRQLFLEKLDKTRVENIQPQPQHHSQHHPQPQPQHHSQPQHQFFNVSLKEFENIPFENRFIYKIGEHLLVYDAKRLATDTDFKYTEKNNNGSTKHLYIPIELPYKMSNESESDPDFDPDFEVLYYSIEDPIVLQIFDDAVGIITKELEFENDFDFKNGYVSISDDEYIDSEININNYESNYASKLNAIYTKLNSIGILYDRKESEQLITDLLKNNLDAGLDDDSIFESIVNTFI